MESFFEILKSQLTSGEIPSYMRAAFVLLMGLVLLKMLPPRIRLPGAAIQQNFLFQQLSRYGIVLFTGIWILRELGFDLNVLLGAAGLLTVAFGFASQTSASNLISGLFLLGEQPFGIGDVIKVADVTGEVLSIDALSVKIRTFDNLMVRIPNETVLKSNVTNLTRFPIRRLDMPIGVAYKEDLGLVREVLMDVADRIDICLDEPRPLIIFQGYGESSVDLQLSVWALKENFLELRNTMYEEVKRRFDEEGIEIPFPQRTLTASLDGHPLPIQLLGAPGSARAG